MKLIISFFTAALVLIGGPAFAVADDATDTPQVLYPLHTWHKGQIRIAIQGPTDTHGLRRFAREVDSKLPGVTIYENSRCVNHPHAECVKVRFKHYGKTNWYAETAMYDPTREIRVNLDLPNDHPHAVMCHEFGHILGLQHHKMDGVDGGEPNVIHLSEEEQNALNNAYQIRSGGLD